MSDRPIPYSRKDIEGIRARWAGDDAETDRWLATVGLLRERAEKAEAERDEALGDAIKAHALGLKVNAALEASEAQVVRLGNDLVEAGTGVGLLREDLAKAIRIIEFRRGTIWYAEVEDFIRRARKDHHL